MLEALDALTAECVIGDNDKVYGEARQQLIDDDYGPNQDVKPGFDYRCLGYKDVAKSA